MTRLRVRAEGPRAPEDVWDRYCRPHRWPEWSPQMRRVETEADVVVPGAAGTVHGPAGIVVRFVVVDVDAVHRQWSWLVRVGPVRLHLDHAVRDRAGGGSIAEAVVDGPWPFVRAYRLPVWVALRRLVR